MTHPKEAIELMAAALAKAHGNENDNLFYGKRAVQVLDRIAPMLVAAEREQCAAICEAIEMAEWDKWKRYADMYAQGASSGAEECAAAIRARSEKWGEG